MNLLLKALPDIAYVPAPYEAPTIKVMCGTIELDTALINCEPFFIMPWLSKSFPTKKPVTLCKNINGISLLLQS